MRLATLALFLVLVACSDAESEIVEGDRAAVVTRTLDPRPREGWAKTCDHLVASKTKSPSGFYYVTSFGWWNDGKSDRHDPDDDGIPWCDSQVTSNSGDQKTRFGPEVEENYRAVCPTSEKAGACEIRTKWFAAGADRYGCGAHLKVTNVIDGKSVVVVVVDQGASCAIEKRANVQAFVTDLSYPAVQYLFGTEETPRPEFAANEGKTVEIVEVSPTTPLGPSETASEK